MPGTCLRTENKSVEHEGSDDAYYRLNERKDNESKNGWIRYSIKNQDCLDTGRAGDCVIVVKELEISHTILANT